MESLRFKAIDKLGESNRDVKVGGSSKVTAIFGQNVFTLKVARAYLSDEAYKSLQDSVKSGKKIDRSMGNQISSGLLHCAESRDVTHFKN